LTNVCSAVDFAYIATSQFPWKWDNVDIGHIHLLMIAIGDASNVPYVFIAIKIALLLGLFGCCYSFLRKIN
jgi:hypothetical protein